MHFIQYVWRNACSTIIHALIDNFHYLKFISSTIHCFFVSSIFLIHPKRFATSVWIKFVCLHSKVRQQTEAKNIRRKLSHSVSNNSAWLSTFQVHGHYRIHSALCRWTKKADMKSLKSEFKIQLHHLWLNFMLYLDFFKIKYFIKVSSLRSCTKNSNKVKVEGGDVIIRL